MGLLLNAYQIDEASWYSGRTAEEARQLYIADLGEDEAKEALDSFGAPQQVTEAGLDRMKIVDVDEPGQPSRTFREALAEQTEPGFLATTDY